MRLKMEKLIGVNTPPDGFTEEEKRLIPVLGENTVEAVYRKLPNSRMKAIVSLHFELGYKQDLVARIFNCTQSEINQEIGYIRKVLADRPHRPHREKKAIKISDLLRLVVALQKP